MSPLSQVNWDNEMSRSRRIFGVVAVAVAAVVIVALIARFVGDRFRLHNEIDFINSSGRTILWAEISLSGDIIHVGEIPDGGTSSIRVSPGSREFFFVRVRLSNGEEVDRTWGDEGAGRMWGRRWQVLILPDHSIRIVGMGLRSNH